MPDVALIALGAVGVAVGLGLLLRGLLAERSAARLEGIGSSKVGLLAAGEVRITGEAQAAGVTLTSPVRARQCLYYRAIGHAQEGDAERTLFDEERGVGFFVRDASGEVRVFPRGARWEVSLDEPTPWAEGRAGRGGSFLLPAAPDEDPLHQARDDHDFAMPMLLAGAGGGSQRDMRYSEGRIEPGDTVTIIGRAVPFRDLADPTELDSATDELAMLSGAVDHHSLPDPRALHDPEVAASYARALEEGTLESSPTEAWGNAAIEGFGIGQPVRPPELDTGINPATAADAGSAAPAASPADAVARQQRAAEVARSFEIPPDRLVIAAGPDVSLLIAAGTPAQAVARHAGSYRLGLIGALLAIGSAVLLAIVWPGG
jgi:hypothetical protein